MYPQNMALYGTVPPFQDPGVPIEFKIGRISYIYISSLCAINCHLFRLRYGYHFLARLFWWVSSTQFLGHTHTWFQSAGGEDDSLGQGSKYSGAWRTSMFWEAWVSLLVKRKWGSLAAATWGWQHCVGWASSQVQHYNIIVFLLFYPTLNRGRDSSSSSSK